VIGLGVFLIMIFNPENWSLIDVAFEVVLALFLKLLALSPGINCKTAARQVKLLLCSFMFLGRVGTTHHFGWPISRK